MHTSTYSENALAMRAGLASLEALDVENAGEQATQLGAWLRGRLVERLTAYEMIREIRGIGMLTGIEFSSASQTPPASAV